MTKKQLLKKLSQTYCRIGVSKIHGVGVIAIRDIPKGADPFVGSFSGEGVSFTKKDFANIHPNIRKMIYDYFIPENNTFEIPVCGLNGLDISFFMNHSHRPNVTSNDNFETFVTLRDIKAGEELTYIYPEEKKVLVTFLKKAEK